MRVLVTGGAGFIGSHLVDALVEAGEEVVVFDDLSSGHRENLSAAITRGAELIEADITNADSVASVFDEHEPEVVYHLAAQMDVRYSVANPRFDLEVNVAGTVSLLDHARRVGSRRLIFASTGGAIYGEGEGRELPLDESAECVPDAPYGQSKLAAEGYLSLFERLYAIPTVALRLGNVYGPRQDPHGEAGVVAIFLQALLGDRRPRVFGDGEQTRDYIFVGDVVAAFLAATERGSTGRAYNVGTGVETSVLELGRLLADATNQDFDPQTAPARLGEVQRIAIDSSAAESELGWRAERDLADGLAETAAWFAKLDSAV